MKPPSEARARSACRASTPAARASDTWHTPSAHFSLSRRRCRRWFAVSSAGTLPGRAHTWLLVVIVDKDGGDEMRKWFDAAKTRVPASVHRASILTLKVPFFVSAGTVRGKAREKVPRVFWGDTWLDKNGAMGKALGLATSRTPYAFVLDARGRVVAAVHGTADAREAQAVWDALSRS